MIKLAATLFIFLGVVSPANAEYVSATDLAEACENRSDTGPSVTFCEGYIFSAYENLIWGAAVAYKTQMGEGASLEEMNDFVLKALNMCIPWSVSEDEILNGVVAYVDTYPNLDEISARTVVHRGLMHLYGCPDDW